MWRTIGVYFSARIKPTTPAGTTIYNHTEDLLLNETGLGSGNCAFNSLPPGDNPAQPFYFAPTGYTRVDGLDYDGDGNVTEQRCPSASVSYVVPVISTADSSKWVKGSLDTAWSRYPASGDTDTNGNGAYELYITNQGNTPLTTIDLVDVLPYVGDTSVTSPAMARGSQWGEELVSLDAIEHQAVTDGPYSGVPAEELVTGFSASKNPCRWDTADPNETDRLKASGGTFPSTASVTGPVGCDNTGWTTTQAGARSFAIRYTPATALQPGASIRLKVTVKLAPGEAPSLPVSGKIAWNSFGFSAATSAAAPNDVLLSTEPIQVGLKMIDTSLTASLGDYVWVDVNHDGTQNEIGMGIEGVTVALYNGAGTLVDTTLTDATGYYRFWGLDPTTPYRVVLANAADYTSGPLAPYELTLQNVGGDALDSDAAIIASLAEITSAPTGVAGSNTTTYDFGFWQKASLGDYVWEDSDGNGAQDSGEPGVSGVTVRLFAQAGTPLGTTTTNSAGYYRFDNLVPGTYYVVFDKSTAIGTGADGNPYVGYRYTSPNATGDEINDSDPDSAGRTALITLVGGQHDPRWDAGITPPLPPGPNSIGDFTWIDLDQDGFQDPTEPVLPGVTVTLLDANGFGITSLVTDGTGRYLFAGLPDGDYSLRFEPPPGYILTKLDDALTADDTSDSDAHPASGLTVITNLDNGAAAENDMTWDAGFIPTFSLGNVVWLDANDDGLFGVSEQAIAGVTVKLFAADGTTEILVGPDGVLGSADDAAGGVVTNASGHYLLTNLPAGDYIVEITPPVGHLSSVGNGVNPALTGTYEGAAVDQDTTAVDNDDNGTTVGAVVRSAPVTLSYNAEPTLEGLTPGWPDATPDGNGNYQVDFGLYKIDLTAYDLALAKVASVPGVVANGATIIWTVRVQNQGMVPSGSFSVTDTLPAGLTFVSASDGGTNSAGIVTWSLTNPVAPGTYVDLTVTTTVADLALAPYRNWAEISADSGNDRDSTPDTDTGSGQTLPNDSASPGGGYVDVIDPTTIAADGAPIGDEDDNDDAVVTGATPVYDLAVAKIADVTTVNGNAATINWTVRVHNQGNMPSGNYSVTDTLPAGLTFVSASDGGTEASGVVTWNLITTLAAGTFKDLTFSTTVADITRAPFRNWAEISADSGVDKDSAPDVDTGSGATMPNDATAPGGGYSPITDLVTIATDLSPNADEDDNDDAVVDGPYDLALAKIAGVASVNDNGTSITWTVRVRNQGYVPSGNYSVTDTLPAGMTFITASDGGIEAAGVVTWNMVDTLLPGEFKDLTITTQVGDITTAPFRNWAEISADSGDDADSTPDTVTGSGQTLPNDATAPGGGYVSITDLATIDVNGAPAADEDDNDDAVVDGPYDLALAKVTTSTSVSANSETVVWTVRVQNQGYVPSGNYSVTDTLPAGLTFASASDGGANASGIVTWDLTTSLVPGEFKDLTLTTTVTDVTKAPFRNWAEISADSGTDKDSTPDVNTGSGATMPNDATAPGGGYVGVADLATLSTDGTPAADEDDNDDASVGRNIYDLALRKKLVSFAGGVATFNLEVFNQGDPVAAIDVTDYIDTAVWQAFDTALNPSGTTSATVAAGYVAPATLPTFVWNTAGTNPVVTITGPMGTAEAVTVPVRVRLKSPLSPLPATAVNTAEISEFRNAAGLPLVDADSIPDGTNGNDAGGRLDSPADDAIDGNGTGAPGGSTAATDEDDSDSAAVPLYDLALTKKLSAGQAAALSLPPAPATVSFDIAVTNQGATDAFVVEVTDTPPAGMSFVSVIDASGTAPRFTIPYVAAGATVTFSVTYQIDDTSAASYTNVAEISSFADDDDSTTITPVWVVDVDSRPDSDVTNDAGGLAGSASDDSISGDGSGAPGEAVATTDEDDADPAVVTLPYDLALRKRVDPTDPDIADGIQLLPTPDKVTFYIEVFNQGRDVASIDVTDYVPAGSGWSFIAADNPAGTASAGSYGPPVALPAYSWSAADATKPVATITGAIQGGRSVVIPVVLTATAPLPADDLKNIAEISAFRDAAGTTLIDIDSTPDATDGDVIADDVIDSNATNPPDGFAADEDDHDAAIVAWWDLSLVKTASAFVLDAADPTMTFTVSVKNQGVRTAYAATVVDTVPAGTSVVSTTPGTGVTCGVASPNVTCTVAQLDAGATATFEITLYVDDMTIGTYENVAEITSMQGDVDLGAGPVRGAVTDIDSTMDTDPTNDALFLNPNDPFGYPRNSSNQIDFTQGVNSVNEANALDEDDHDVQAVILPLAVGDYVWYDVNRNGVQDAGEKPVVGAGVKLTMEDPATPGSFIAATDAQGNPVSTTVVTDGNGWYVFDDLLPGTYRVQFTHNQSGWLWTVPNIATAATDAVDSDAVFTLTTADATAITDPFVLAAGQPNVAPVTLADGGDLGALKAANIDRTRDAGIWMPVAVGDYVWYDLNHDGQQTAGEPVVGNVTVNLLMRDPANPAGPFVPGVDANGSLVPATSTDPTTGLYVFDELVPGDYQVQFDLATLPAGYSVTKQAQGADRATDSNPDATGLTPVFTLSTSAIPNMVANSNPDVIAAFIDPTIDMGIFKPVSLGDLVWYDANRDGVYDPSSEKGVADVAVTLLMKDAAGSMISATDADGVAVATTQVTNANGRYSFANLLPGDYQVVFGLPSGYLWTKPNTPADDTLDSDSVFATLTDATAKSQIVTVSGFAPVTDSDPKGLILTDPSIDAGVWYPYALGDVVWYDLNHNGSQESGELPVAGALIHLLMEDPANAGSFIDATDADGTLVADQTTVADGLYLFDNLLAGNYRVEFTHNQAGYRWTVGNTGLDTVDSDAMFLASTDATSISPLISLGPTAANLRPADPVDSTTYAGPLAGGTLKAHFVDPTNDAGIWQPVGVGNYVWYDLNHNGIQDLDEKPVGNVGVKLLIEDPATPGSFIAATDANGAAVAQTTTDPVTGLYQFDNLIPGVYRVQFVLATLPTGYVVTRQAQGTNAAIDSNPDLTGLTPAFTLSIDGANMVANTDPLIDAVKVDPTIDMGIFTPVSLGDLVWYDANHNGIFDPLTELGIESVKTELLMEDPATPGAFIAAVDADGVTTTPDYTDAQGRYSYTNLASGNYKVVFSLPFGFEWTTSNAAGNDTLDSDATYTTVEDAMAMSHIASVFADAPVADSDVNGLTLTDPSIDAGVWFALSIGDYVWYDLDRDGIQDVGERPVVGATAHLLVANDAGTYVTALDADGVTVADDTTDASGLYLFDYLVPGTYKVVFTHNQPGFQWTFSDSLQGTDATDSDAAYLATTDATASTGVITLSYSATNVRSTTVADDTAYGTPLRAAYINPTNDAGIWQPLAMGDYVWYDTNHNGVQDDGELPVGGIKVHLLMEDPTQPGTFNPAKQSDGNAVPVAITDATTGLYSFDNLLPGTYRAQFEIATLPAGYVPTIQTAGADSARDSNPDLTGLTSPFSLTVDGVNMQLNDDPLIDGFKIDPTIDMGIFQALAVGDYVWNDVNHDGLQDAGEAPIAGVVVTLLNADGSPATDADGNVVAVATTDVNGHYVFDNLFAGDYKIQFATPDRWRVTLPMTGTELNDSNPETTGLTPVFTLSFDSTNVRAVVASDGVTVAQLIDPSIDAGFWQPLAIGDYVWFDLDHNGIQDPSEKPVAGATAALLNASGGAAVDADGMPVPSATTDVNGHYVFDNLLAGSYQVKFSNLPAGYQVTSPASGADRSVDSNPDTTGLTPIFTLDAGSPQVRGVVGRDGATTATLIDPTIDAGIWMPLAVGDFVWYDVNHNGLQDPAELPVVGVTATLLNADGSPAIGGNGQPVPATTTDANGHYVFDNLPAGTYKIAFTTLPSGYDLTTPSASGSTSATDSNPDATGMTGPFELTVGGTDMRPTTSGDGTTTAVQINPTIDGGVYRYSVDLVLSKTAIGTVVAGQVSTWRIVVSNIGPDAEIGTITVVDTLPAELTFVEASGTGWTCTAVGQIVTCTTDQDLAPGTSLPNLTISAKVSNGASGEIVNGATVSSPRPDVVQPNNATQAKAPVVTGGALPNTGADILRILGVGGLLVALGVAVFASSRRRRRIAPNV